MKTKPRPKTQNPHAIRYTAEKADVANLRKDYDVDESIATLERTQHFRGHKPWQGMMNDVIPLSPALTPALHATVSSACQLLGLKWTLLLFTSASAQINAYACLDRFAKQPTLSLCLTSRAIEELSENELLFLVGHELGHVLFEHDRLNLLCQPSEGVDSLTILPFLGEWLFLRWRQKAEISADRVGWLLTEDFEAGAGAIIKAATGLGSNNLTLNSHAIDSFLNEAIPMASRHILGCQNAPMLSVRLQALQCLNRTAPRPIRTSGKQASWLGRTDKVVAEGLSCLSRRPATAALEACMHLIADAGVEIIQHDHEVEIEEIKKVMNILHDHYTDQPDQLICLNSAKRALRIRASIRTLNRIASSSEKKEALSRLSDIAIADGPLGEADSKTIFTLAKALRIPVNETNAIIVGCVQNKSRSIDPGLVSLAHKIEAQSRTTKF